ncbi:MAG: hypothetical protein D3925_06655, partial [Candidatus Electrothrix sp. AR5]|nr:hypothetical protein [Candidatus Electrothrix sp. AR5]
QTRPVEKEKQRITAKFADITKAFSSGSATDEKDKGEESDSSLFFDDSESALGLSRDSATDFFIEDDSENSAAADAASLFDDISSSAPPAQEAVEAVEDDFLFQGVDEEDDFFGSAVAGLSESPEDSEDLFGAPGIPEKEQSRAAAEVIDPELQERAEALP